MRPLSGSTAGTPSGGQWSAKEAPPGSTFAAALERHGVELRRGRTHTLQVNVGLLCNQRCRHCHLDAGPMRREAMDRDTMEEVIAYARRASFQTIDITGGAPEMLPDLPRLIEALAPLTPRLMLRSNLTAISNGQRRGLMHLCRANRVVIVASFPSTSASQTEAQRGTGVWERSLATLRELNALGYGEPGSDLELDLVSSPAGAFLPAPQDQLEKKFRRDLSRRWGITFTNLYALANVPLGRFRAWLEESGNLAPYLQRLAESFNPCTLDGLMCRSQVSLAWDGHLFDCDFNLASGLPFGGTPCHVTEMEGPPEPGTPIATGDHCYACTAGAGFT